MKSHRYAAALATAFALPVFAGDVHLAQNEAEQWRAYGESMRSWAQSFSNDMQSSMAYMFSDRVGRGKVVKGAPYSAEVVTEMNQALSDGNVITHKTTNRVYRDGDGRTRQDTFRGEALHSVYISDPVAGASYTLLPASRIAVSVPRVERGERAERGERVAPRAPGKASGDGAAQETERKIVVRTLDGRDGAHGAREEVRVQVIRIDGRDAPLPPTPPVAPVPPAPGVAPLPPLPPLPPIPAIPGVHTMRFESTAGLGKGVTTKLAVKDVDGVKAEGSSTVWTIPAGRIGNRNAILVTKESWYAPELQVTLYSRHNDPRTGESIYRLAGIKRAEPSPDLFKVPEGYTVKGRVRRNAAPEAKPGNSPG